MKKTTKLILPIIVLLTIGCASVPIASKSLQEKAKSLSPTEKYSAVYIFRKRKYVAGGLLCSVEINSKQWGYIRSGTYIAGLFKPGRYEINLTTLPVGRSRGSKLDTSLRVDLKGGRKYYYIAAIYYGPSPPIVTELTESQGNELLKSYSLVGDNTLEDTIVSGVPYRGFKGSAERLKKSPKVRSKIYTVPVSKVKIMGRINSIHGDMIELNLSLSNGIKIADTGRIFYTVTIEGTVRSIFVAKFKITHVSTDSSIARIEKKTENVKAGYLVEIIRD